LHKIQRQRKKRKKLNPADGRRRRSTAPRLHVAAPTPCGRELTWRAPHLRRREVVGGARVAASRRRSAETRRGSGPASAPLPVARRKRAGEAPLASAPLLCQRVRKLAGGSAHCVRGSALGWWLKLNEKKDSARGQRRLSGGSAHRVSDVRTHESGSTVSTQGSGHVQTQHPAPPMLQ
jgi:hypothetical protein